MIVEGGEPHGWVDWFGWSGRMGRARFALRLLVVVFATAAVWAGAFVTMLSVHGYGQRSPGAPLDAVVTVIAWGTLATGTWIVLAAQARRAHDLGLSAAWVLVNLVPLGGWVAALAIALFWPGQAQDNPYGSPPR
jgi:uncharacterized membrane protein YhaH (DUF805 family)